MKTSDAGIALIKSFEGLRLDSYQDLVGVWTIGYGTTRGAEPGQHITEARAEAMLRADLQHVEGVLNAALKVPVTQHQFDACASLAYNVGCGNFTRSTLLKKLNAGDATAATEFLRWNRAGGKVLDGLTRRREAEKALFESA